MTRLACVVGARPNFVKMAPLLSALDGVGADSTLVHTGQHYDAGLSDVFFEQLGIRRPDIALEVGSGSHGAQTARVLERFEQVLVRADDDGRPFDGVVVVGDVNSTLACALAAVKLHIRVAHVEAGLRSGDRAMPEEINRIMTDAIADCLLVTEPAGVENLRAEGVPASRIHLVGNVMIDTLRRLLPRARAQPTLTEHGLSAGGYGVVTLHRPANVDARATLEPLLRCLVDTARRLPLIWPLHPRTRDRIERHGLESLVAEAPGLTLLPPLGYLPFLCLTSQAAVIVTDSGGLQEESTALQIPCLTLRPTTERPITISEGSSTLIGSDAALLAQTLAAVLEGQYREGRCPALWDGHAAERIAPILAAL